MPQRDVLSDLVSKATAVAVRNVMNPLLWLNATVVPAGFTVVVLLQETLILAIPIMMTTLAVPIFTLKHYGYFAKHAPQRLQSEEFIIQQQRLMIQQKGSEIEIDITTLELGSNPEIPALPDWSDNQKASSQLPIPHEVDADKGRRDV
ncbi:MAG: hypothetical protein ACK4MH_06725 [Brevundimonas sp.]|uniref:hypothetical protein n=1 Tax=Brevundimonas sp. TaxID=1871086 RepID=UPI00391D5220